MMSVSYVWLLLCLLLISGSAELHRGRIEDWLRDIDEATHLNEVGCSFEPPEKPFNRSAFLSRPGNEGCRRFEFDGDSDREGFPTGEGTLKILDIEEQEEANNQPCLQIGSIFSRCAFFAYSGLVITTRLYLSCGEVYTMKL